MSMGQELIDEMLIADAIGESDAEDLLAQGLWMTAKGVVLLIDEMETSHLENTLHWLKNNEYYFREEYMALMQEELDDRLLAEFEEV